MKLAGPQTQVIDLGGRRVIPGLIDSHTHLIRGGPQLQHGAALGRRAVARRRHADVARNRSKRTPPPQWVRVVGGFNEFQFAEKRMPTLKEFNEAAPDTPVFILRLYDRALLNRAALRAVGLHQGHKRPAGQPHRARQERRAHRHAAREAQRD